MKQILIFTISPAAFSLPDIPLQAEGFALTHTGSAQSTLEAVEQNPPDLLLIAAGSRASALPGFLREVRLCAPALPVMVAAPAENTALQKQLYDSGADFVADAALSAEELTLHIKSLLRRTCREIPAVRVIGSTVFRRDTLTVSHGKGVVPLSPREFRLLNMLAEQPGQCFSMAALSDEIRDYIHSGSLENCIASLRKKLADCEDFTVEAVDGKGYAALFRTNP